MNYKKSLFLLTLVSSFLLSSCSLLERARDRFKKTPDIEGAEYISTPDDISSQLGSDSGQLSGLSSVYFDLDSSSLKDEVKNILNNNKEWLDSKPNVKQIILEGHCDPLGSEAYNIGLGERRAQAVFNYLISIGVSPDKMNIVSYGEEKPISEIDNTLNRRVNFVPQY